METPKSAKQGQRAHGPKTQLSSTKKALFGKDDSHESDLGPITPLRFGSRRKTSTQPNGTLNNITSFRNLFGNESPDSDRSLSPDFAQKYTNNGRYELLTAGHDKENQHAVDEETRFSFHSIPETPSGRLSVEQSTLLDENNSNSLSLQMSADLNLIEKRAQPMHLTPRVTRRSTSTQPSQLRSNEPSHRRAEQHVKSALVATPDGNDQVKEKCGTATRSNVKARTVLHFNEMPISTKSFYSSSIVEKPERLHPKPITAPTPPVPPVKSSSKEISPSATTKSSVATAKTPRKNTSMRKRSKSISSSAPRLGQRGVVHKIRKPSKKPGPKAKTSPNSKDHEHGKESKTGAKRNTKQPQKNRAIAGGTKSCPTTPKASETKKLEHDALMQQLERVKVILEKSKNSLQRARPLSMARSMTDLSKATLSCGEEADSSSSEDEDSALEDEDGPEGTRKFFTSRSGSRSNRKVYNHFNSISLAVRKGGKRKLINFPQAPKRRRTDFANEEFDFEMEQLEVDDLISRLDQGSRSTIVCHEQQQQQEQPYETSEYDLGDDEPIPIQSNIIYLTVEDFVLEDAQMEHNMIYEEPMYKNETIIIRHDGEHQGTAIDENELLSEMVVDSMERDLSPYDDQPQCNAEHTIPTTANSENTTEYYPLFYRDRAKELWKHEQTQSNNAAQIDVFHRLRQQERPHKQRHGTGQDQYQLDAGQRAYGAVQCAECGLVYSNNEPEEELIHDNFHRSQANLSFAGWANEHIVSEVPEWDVTGRIIVVSQVDSRQWLAKVRSILEAVDSELGFATHGELPEGACVYLAIARSTVLGVCVVQPLQCANRMISIEGLHGVPIDCYSSEFYPAKCGVSRIWVSPKYRRLGIGRKLMHAINRHYTPGNAMQMAEIAFGAPTESGKLFAECITGRKDFLVYL